MKHIGLAAGVLFLLTSGNAHAQWAPQPPGGPYQPYPSGPPMVQPQQPWHPPPTPYPYRSDKSAGVMGSGSFLAAGSRVSVSQQDDHTTWGGGVLAHGAMSFYADWVSARGGLTALFGGGAGGMETMASVDLSGGLGYAFGPGQIFLRLDIEGYQLKNDELEANTLFFGGNGGIQIITNAIGFEISPLGGFTGRTEFEPGDESDGRRYWRRLNARGAYGGRVDVTTSYLALSGTLLRVADSDPVTIVDANACLYVSILSACGFVQYWRSVATDLVGQPHTVPATWIGFGLGLGASSSRTSAGPLDLAK